MRLGALKLKVQIVCGDGFALGPGKADLLAAIAREGSIAAAGRAMGMSYRRAWLLVDEMNRCFASPVVAALPGGGAGRGARLTALGETVLTDYRALEADLAALADTPAAARLLGQVREQPQAD